MESLYHQTNRLVQDVQGELGRLERAKGDSVHLVENEVQARIDHILSNCERLEILVNKEPPTRRANAKLRVDQLKYDCQHLQSAMRQLQHKRYVREEEEREREALLSRTFTTNDHDHDTSILIDASVQHNIGLSNAHRDMDNIIGHSSSILTNLREQRMTLKGVHKKILDISNSLGLTNTVMRLIEKRTFQDKIVFFVGVVVTCVVMYLVWKYFS
ncbi:Golgi SNAP receptor complex member 2-like [Gigantopelta aegis]|uniref:Golgi SNAP receptor complex member 2-like n=1 Tax=Gigantopelta aegis TaxID=1735272 RepID=UPI001B887570|nr:Golgi SNAP receptor complex member 2-like [Gigantopelta aegis]